MKKYVFGAVALLFAITFSAFTMVRTATPVFYTGSTGQYDVPGNWTDVQPEEECQGGDQQICSIETSLDITVFKQRVQSYPTMSDVLNATNLGLSQPVLREDFE